MKQIPPKSFWRANLSKTFFVRHMNSNEKIIAHWFAKQRYIVILCAKFYNDEKTNRYPLLQRLGDNQYKPVTKIVCLKQYRIVIFPQQNSAETIIGAVCSE